jgi:hypothetical protein
MIQKNRFRSSRAFAIGALLLSAGLSCTDEHESLCSSVSSEYLVARHKAEECTQGAADQCKDEVVFMLDSCRCPTRVNADAAKLKEILQRWNSNACTADVCQGGCRALADVWQCVADTTSSTGGRCAPPP